MRDVRRILGCSALAVGLLAASPRPALAQPPPIVSVWYRGTPAGVPRQDDLALIRSLGFTAVSWPAANAAALPGLRRFAEIVGLQVVSEPDDVLSAGVAVGRLADRVRIRVDRVEAMQVPALAWSAVASGCRLVSFDAGEPEGHGIAEVSGQERAWVRPAVAFARQFAVNAALFDGLQPGPAPRFQSGAGTGTTVALFAAPRTWLLVAANTGRERRDVDVRFPPAIPYALWTSLLDGATMSMLSDPSGPQWTVQLAPGQAVVYFTDR